MRPIFAALVLSLAPLAARADEAQVRALAEAMQLPQILDVMQQEGLDYGDSLADSLFAGQSGSDWPARVASIYDADKMHQGVIGALVAELEGADVAPMLAFFEAEPGRTIAGLEVAARRAMMDDDVTQMAKEAAAIAMADRSDRYKLLARFVEVNDLIEANVIGGLNGNLEFYMGLMEGGALGPDADQASILSDVWAQEPEIRQSTNEWIYSFLTLAYEPLSDPELEAYIAFSETEPGRKLNRALYVAFDHVFNQISHDLGRAAAPYVLGQQL